MKEKREQWRTITMSYIRAARKAQEEIFSLAEDSTWSDVTTKDISTVAVILSSSRSGSSLLAELLKQTPQLLALQGEHVPFYKLNGYSLSTSGLESDRIAPSTLSHFQEISRDFISEIGVASKRRDFRHFARAVVLRLILQWPHFELSAQEWLSYVDIVHRRLLSMGTEWNINRFFLELCNLLCARGYDMNPYYYDLPKQVLQHSCSAYPPPQGPPHPDFCLEEPPFILVRPRAYPTEDEIRRKPLLLKASVDAYCLPFLRRLFPHAQFRVIHLTRNAAACINGLYDGWLDRGFFSHNVKHLSELCIAGYSDVYEWGKYWWKYDLPPGWKKVIGDPLEYVCAFQWYYAHTSIFEDISAQHDIEVMNVKFEQIISSPQERWCVMQRIVEFLGIEFDRPLRSIVTNLPVVMATATPCKQRWHARREQLLPVVTQKHIVALSHELGYSSDEEWL